MKTILLIIIGIIAFSVFSVIIHQNFDFSKTGKTDSFSSPTCRNAMSNLADLANRINPISEDISRSMNISSIPEDMAIKMKLIPGDEITEELLKQKNNATLAVLNNCDVASLTVEEIHELDSQWGRK